MSSEWLIMAGVAALIGVVGKREFDRRARRRDELDKLADALFNARNGEGEDDAVPHDRFRESGDPVNARILLDHDLEGELVAALTAHAPSGCSPRAACFAQWDGSPVVGRRRKSVSGKDRQTRAHGSCDRLVDGRDPPLRVRRRQAQRLNATAVQSSSSRFGSLWVAAFGLLAAFCLFRATSWSDRPEREHPRQFATRVASQTADAKANTQRASHAGSPLDRFVPKRIQEVDLGNRVAGTNPLREQAEEIEPDPATWRRISLQMQKANGLSLWVELLRALKWLEIQNARAGRTIHLELPEMGAVGDALVLDVGPCPPIQSGPGTVVTGRFVHECDGTNVVRLWLEGQPEPTGVTTNHRYWSEERRDFVPAGELRLGELVDTASGPRAVESVEPYAYRGLLYNLETTEHVYRVGSLGTLVHNTCPGQHHFIPVGLGNPIPYGHKSLPFIKGPKHTSLQDALNKFLRTKEKIVGGTRLDMLPRKGNSGHTVRAHFSPTERMNALDEFYKEFQDARYYAPFRMELNVLNDLGGLLP